MVRKSFSSLSAVNDRIWICSSMIYLIRQIPPKWVVEYHQPGKWAVQSRGKTKEFRCAQCRPKISGCHSNDPVRVRELCFRFGFMKPCLSKRIWWEIFGFRCLTYVQPRKPRNYGKKILCQVLFIGLKEDTNTNTTQHILSWKVCKGSTFLRFSKTNRLILSSEKALSFSTHLHSCENNAACFFVIDDLPEKKSGGRWGAKKVGSAAGGNVQGLHWFSSVGVEEFLEEPRSWGVLTNDHHFFVEQHGDGV